MRHVGAAVADPRQHADLARVVQLGERGGGGVPAQARILGERHARGGRDGERRPELNVERISRRGEHRESVDPALQEHGHKHRARRTLHGCRLGDPVPEHPTGETEPVRSVHRYQAAGRAEQEAAAVDPGTGRDRHPRVPFPGRARRSGSERSADRLGARETFAADPRIAPHQQHCHSGVVGISARSAFWRRIRYVTCSQSAVIPRWV